MTTQLGCNSYAFLWSDPAEAILDWGAGLGFSRFDLLLTPGHLWHAEVTADERAALRRRGLIEPTNLPSLDHNLASPRPDAREATVATHHALIDLAADLGAQAIVVVPGRPAALNPPGRAGLEGWIAEGLTALLPHAAQAGVRLLLENLPQSPLPLADDLLRFLDRFEAAAPLGIAYDVANGLSAGDAYLAALGRIRPRLGQVHLSDARRHAWAHDPIGEGEVDSAAVARALSGWHGTAMIEVIAPDGRAAIADALRRLTALGDWRP